MTDLNATPVKRCGQLISGIYGAETICQRIAGHPMPHTSTDGIWRDDASAVQQERGLND